jgi:hypothetical protein
VVVEAVHYEPVSAAEFPALAQFTGIFSEKGPVLDDYPPITYGKSITYDEIPWSREQGIFLREQGILSGEQGIFASLWKFAVERELLMPTVRGETPS